MGLVAVHGCASLVEVRPAAVPSGEEVRVELTPAGAEGLGGSIGPRARYIEGRVNGVTPGGEVRIGASTLARDDGNLETLGGIEITLPADAIEKMELRRVDRGRTMLATAATVAGVVFAGRAFSGGTGGGGGGGGGKSGQ